MQYLTIDLPVRLWQRIDGNVDNSMAIDVVDGVMETVIAGSCVRDAGWRASAAYTGERDEYGWPPQGHPLAITLRREHWDWVLSEMERWRPYTTDDADDDAVVCALIEASLTSQ